MEEREILSFYFPNGFSGAFTKLQFEKNDKKLTIKVPVLTPDQIETILQEVKHQQKQYVKNLKTNDIIQIIDQAVQLWLNPDYPKRKLAEKWLPVITGYDSEMIHLFLTKFLRNFRKEKLQRMIEEDFVNPLVLDEYRPRRSGGLIRAYGPELVTHIFSGNVPGLSLWSMVSGLLLKSATFGKVSSEEPLFPTLFAQTIEEVDPDFAKAIAIGWWKGGNVELEEAAFRHSEAVIGYGGEKAINDLKARIPANTAFFPHSHKVSFGLITKDALARSLIRETARRTANDASWFDQQGCLSPQMYFVQRGGKQTPKDFMRLLANEMKNFQSKMPRAKLFAQEHHMIVSERWKAEFQSFSSDKTELIKSENSTAWTVVYKENDDFHLSPLNRYVTVVPFDEIEDLASKLKPYQQYIQTVGIACSPQQFHPLIEVLGEAQVNRICFIGDMPNPEPGWHHDGRLYLADLVRWVDIESSVEQMVDHYDPWRD